MAAARPSLVDPPVSRRRLFAGADQPPRVSFEFEHVGVGPARTPVETSDFAHLPFCTLVRFAREDGASLPRILVVAPLSCHYAVLLRDFVLGLLPRFQVYVTDWINARDVPTDEGPFGIEQNVAYVVDFMRQLAPDLSVIGFCQAGVPTLVAAACSAECAQRPALRRIVLVAAPIDVMANPSPVARLIKARPLDWYERNAILRVPAGEPGHGRSVYPGSLQWLGLWSYLARHISEGRELLGKLVADDGIDPARFPFIDLYSALMDIPAELFIDVMRHVYHEQTLAGGMFPCCGGVVDLRAVETPLMTVEGALDDIAAPGQTSAAHALCPSIGSGGRQAAVVPGCGHFSLFHGATCRREVLPLIQRFLA